MDNVSAQSGSRHPSSEGDSGNVRNSPYVMQGNIGPNPASDIAEGNHLFLIPIFLLFYLLIRETN